MGFSLLCLKKESSTWHQMAEEYAIPDEMDTSLVWLNTYYRFQSGHGSKLDRRGVGHSILGSI